MANVTLGTLASTDTEFVLEKASADLTYDILENNRFLNVMKEYGIINYEEKLQNYSGDTVKFYNQNRVNSKGFTGDVDVYSRASAREYGEREASIELLRYADRFFTRGSITQQRAEFDLEEGKRATITDWANSVIAAGAFNQLGGNTATSITQTATADTAYSGGDLTNITLLNSAIAPTAQYKATGSQTDLTDDNVTSSHPLTFQDIEDAMTAVTQTYAGIPQWETIKGKSCQAIAFVSHTGLNQLFNQARAAGTDGSISQLRYSTIEGGKEFGSFGDYNMIEVLVAGGNVGIVGVPDNLLPRGVASSAEVANTRRAIICGANALDLAAGDTFGDGSQATVSVRVDTEYKKLNNEDYMSVELLMGGKKRQQNGFGANSGTAYDVATYVITHYSAT